MGHESALVQASHRARAGRQSGDQTACSRCRFCRACAEKRPSPASCSAGARHANVI